MTSYETRTKVKITTLYNYRMLKRVKYSDIDMRDI